MPDELVKMFLEEVIDSISNLSDAMEMSASYFMAIMSEETRELLLCLGTFKRLKMARD